MGPRPLHTSPWPSENSAPGPGQCWSRGPSPGAQERGCWYHPQAQLTKPKTPLPAVHGRPGSCGPSLLPQGLSASQRTGSPSLASARSPWSTMVMAAPRHQGGKGSKEAWHLGCLCDSWRPRPQSMPHTRAETGTNGLEEPLGRAAGTASLFSGVRGVNEGRENVLEPQGCWGDRGRGAGPPGTAQNRGEGRPGRACRCTPGLFAT